jgi:hypothetical protein
MTTSDATGDQVPTLRGNIWSCRAASAAMRICRELLDTVRDWETGLRVTGRSR